MNRRLFAALGIVAAFWLVVTLGLTTTVVAVDGDRTPVVQELAVGTDPLDGDTDDDGVGDTAELRGRTDPLVADTDGDGLDDGREREVGTDATVADTDGDGLRDGPEVHDHGSDPTARHSDDDGVADGREVAVGTDPTAADTDGDGLTDDVELDWSSDPTVADTDGDGLADGAEREQGTLPNVTDTDADGLRDGPEVDNGTDPLVNDTDGDGFADGLEMTHPKLQGADPTRMDFFVEVDVIEGATVHQSALDTVEQEFADHGMRVHFVVNQTGLPGPETVWAADRDGSPNDLVDYYVVVGDNVRYGYHYLLVAKDVDSRGTGDAAGVTTTWMMGVESKPADEQAALVLHELGHSLGIRGPDFEGVDSRTYSFSEYHSAMNYNAPNDYVGLSKGPPFDDWEAIRTDYYPPPMDAFESDSGGGDDGSTESGA